MNAIMKVFENDRCTDRLEITLYPNGKVEFRAEEDWAGDTETGFGAFASFTLSANEVVELLNLLARHQMACNAAPTP